MSTSTRVGRNPFDKPAKTTKPVQTVKASQTEKPSKAKKVLKTSDKKTEAASRSSKAPTQLDSTAPLNGLTQAEPRAQKEASPLSNEEEQIISEIIDLSENDWQPLTAVPAGFIKQLFARWI